MIPKNLQKAFDDMTTGVRELIAVSRDEHIRQGGGLAVGVLIRTALDPLYVTVNTVHAELAALEAELHGKEN